LQDKSHSIRYFLEALELNPSDAAAAIIVARMRDLFAIDAEAREKELDVSARHGLRQQRAVSLLDQIYKHVKDAQSTALPSSKLGKGCHYTIAQWPKLTRFLEYPELELSNNLAENSMRPVAIGRKNWIHVGSAKAGPKIAAILSVVETCRRLKRNRPK
jgi:transposase